MSLLASFLRVFLLAFRSSQSVHSAINQSNVYQSINQSGCMVQVDTCFVISLVDGIVTSMEKRIIVHTDGFITATGLIPTEGKLQIRNDHSRNAWWHLTVCSDK